MKFQEEKYFPSDFFFLEMKNIFGINLSPKIFFSTYRSFSAEKKPSGGIKNYFISKKSLPRHKSHNFDNKKKHFFFPPTKMRFSIQEDGQNKKFFHTSADAQKETGLKFSVIKTVLERNNSSHHRRSDNKLFFIKKESPVKILTVQGKDFFSLEEIQQEFGLTPTKFMNQIKNQNFPHTIDWISPEILSPRNSSSEKSSEVESLRKEMRKKFSEVESLRKEMRKEIDFLSARVLQLEKEKELKERKSSPEKSEETSSGEKIPFDTSKKLSDNTLDSVKTIAKFIRFGITGKMFASGPKKNKTVALDGKIVYVPDLLKEIISSHIKEQMYTDGDEESKMAFVERFAFRKIKNGRIPEGRTFFLRKVRMLDEETIHEFSAEFMQCL